MGKKMMLWIIVPLILMGIGGYGLVGTSRGSEFLLRLALAKYVEKDGVSWRSLQGNLLQGITVAQLAVERWKRWPEGIVLKIQRIFVHASSINKAALSVDVDNARLWLPHADPIVVQGSLRSGRWDLNAYTNSVDSQQVKAYVPLLQRRDVKGTVTDVDLFVRGAMNEPEVTGQFLVDKVSFKGFSLTEAPVDLDLRVKNSPVADKIVGNLMIHKGFVHAKQVIVKLEESRIAFSGADDNPSLQVKGSTTVGRVRIRIGLRGTIKEPELDLSSEPPLPKQMLMVMLATGKRWQGVEKSVEQDTLSPDVTKDFIDYFLFAGRGAKFARQFGIYDVIIQYDKDKKGIGGKKELTEKFDVGYGVEQKAVDANGKEGVTQRLSGEYKVTDRLSVGVEKELKGRPKGEAEALDETDPSDDKGYLKYKRSF